MTSPYESTTLEPDLTGLLRDQWRSIVAIGIVCAFAAILLGSSREAVYTSSASIVVEDPRTSTLFEAGSAQSPERYVQTQIEVLQSASVAKRASELLDPDVAEITPEAILADTTLSSGESSDLIDVIFRYSTPEGAEAVANVLIDAYLELRQSESLAAYTSALDELDLSIQESQDEVAALAVEVQTVSASAPIRGDVEQLYQQSVAKLIALSADGAVDPLELSSIESQLNATRTVLEIEADRAGARPELAAVLEEQRLALGRLSELISRRNGLAVDAKLATTGVAFRSDARPAEKESPGALLYGIVGMVVGLLAGAGLAYGREIRRRRFDSAFEPELVLGSPLLGVIPRFDSDYETSLPVVNSPQSEAAEAFRIALTAVEAQMTRPEGLSGTKDSGARDHMLFVTSSAPGEGRTTVAANIALAAARSGRRVLVLDADFATQRLTKMLLPEEQPIGISEVVVGTSSLEAAINPVQIGPGSEIFILSRGSDVLSAQDLFGSKEAANIIEEIRHGYDLILIDSPPFQQVGYATTLARLADNVLVVVGHRSPVSNLDELRKRLSLIRTRDIGYVYNRASLGLIQRFGRHTPSAEPMPDFADA